MQRLLPPHMFVLCGLASIAIGRLLPVMGPADVRIRFAGIVVLVGGVLLTVRGAAVFDAVKTNIKTFDDPDVFVRAGLFRYSRNPMYLGFTVALCGIFLLVGSLSALVGPAVFWLFADRWYNPFEERRMLERFGPSYQRYRSEVPRWIGRAGLLKGSA